MTGSFGPFRLLREIGSGSAARVYEAERDGTRVALKVFYPGKQNKDRQSVLKEFQNELGAIQHLNHPNIIKVIDSDIVEGQPYMAMELLSSSLESRLRTKGALSVPEVDSLLQRLADALDYAHARGVLHRDVKPSNILFDDSNRPVLSDFGVARFLPPRDESTTQLGSELPGTTDFLAPEVLEEAPHSTASDLYSLAMTVYRALTGKLATDGGTIFTRSRARVAGKLVTAAERNPNISSVVSDVVMNGLSTRPTDRFSSARAFASAFNLAASGRPVGAKSVPIEKREIPASGPTEAAWRAVLALPRPLRVAAIALAGVALVAMALWEVIPAASQERLLESLWHSPRSVNSTTYHYRGIVNNTVADRPVNANLTITIDEGSVSGSYTNDSGDSGLITGSVDGNVLRLDLTSKTHKGVCRLDGSLSANRRVFDASYDCPDTEKGRVVLQRINGQ